MAGFLIVILFPQWQAALLPDDAQNLEHQLEVYDALYAWCRLHVARER